MKHKSSSFERLDKEHQLCSLVDSLPSGIGYIDKNKIFCYINKTYAGWFGVTAEELIGRSLLECLSEDAYAGIKEHLRQALAGKRCSFEMKRTFPAASSMHVRIEYTPHFGASEEAEGVFALVTDITDLKKAEAELLKAKEEALEALAENISLTRALTEKNQQLEITAATDLLTGLCNRYKLDEVLAREIGRAARYKHDHGLVMLDVDHFKQVNDTYGHQSGDQVLVEMGQILLDKSRFSDIVGRWGGEEFLIICPETDLNGLAVLAENLRRAVETHNFPVVGQKTSSFGVASYHSGEDATKLLTRADEALYRAKELGRNKVVKAT